MFPPFRLFLVILLVMLQSIAPLVHAHAGESRVKTGLHVPGLELYGAAAASLTCETAEDHASSDTGLFDVDAGIKQSQDTATDDADNSHCLLQAVAIFIPPFSTFTTAVSPRSPPDAGFLPSSSHTPRAPPAQS